jgi:hypothetical protein
MAGLMIYGHEVRTVRLCGETKTYWLQTSSEIQTRIKEQSSQLSKTPYQPLYLVFTGAFTDELEGEFAKEYDGAVLLKKVHTLSARIPVECK